MYKNSLNYYISITLPSLLNTGTQHIHTTHRVAIMSYSSCLGIRRVLGGDGLSG